MIAEIPQAELDCVRDWAERQLAGGSAVPWRAFLLTRLCETIDALRTGMVNTQPDPAASTPTHNMLRLVVDNSAPSERALASRPLCGKALRSGRLTKALVTRPVV